MGCRLRKIYDASADCVGLYLYISCRIDSVLIDDFKQILWYNKCNCLLKRLSAYATIGNAY